MPSHLKNKLRFLSILFCINLFFTGIVSAQTIKSSLTVVIIRHGEKPKSGDNLNCQGLNRAQLLPAVIFAKFGVPAYSYIPSLGSDSTTKHARMFQTITPLAVKYNLAINSKFSGKDSAGLASDIVKRSGIVLVVWDHKSIVPIVHAFGINEAGLKWDDADFDSIWIIHFENGKAILTKSIEGLHPGADCN
jgi:hypothetical protein